MLTSLAPVSFLVPPAIHCFLWVPPPPLPPLPFIICVLHAGCQAELPVDIGLDRCVIIATAGGGHLSPQLTNEEAESERG